MDLCQAKNVSGSVVIVPAKESPIRDSGIVMQASLAPQDNAVARTTSADGRLVKSASGVAMVLVSDPPAAIPASSVPHPATPAQTSRSAASEAQALAQEAAQLKAQAQNFKASCMSAAPISTGRELTVRKETLCRWGKCLSPFRGGECRLAAS